MKSLWMILIALPCWAQEPRVLPPHDRAPQPGVHPRLFAAPEELEALRKKVNAPGTLSKHLFDIAVAQARAEAGLPSFYGLMNSAAPMVSLLLESPDARKAMARQAIDSSLAAIREFDPPYPNKPEWYQHLAYRYIALTYDCCYDELSEAERREFQEEILRISAHFAAPWIEVGPGNHSIAKAACLLMLAAAVQGDVSEEPRLVQDEPVVYGGDEEVDSPLYRSSQADPLRYRSGCEILSAGLSPGEKRFVLGKGKDFEYRWVHLPYHLPVDGHYGLAWFKGGAAPRKGETYFVTYRFRPRIQVWKHRVRLAVQRNLDDLWCEGAYLGGVAYGTWTLNWLVDASEVLRRDMGLDFARHPSIRDAVLWLPSELIPSPAGQIPLCANLRNDSTYQGIDAILRPVYLAWAMGRYAEDPEGRGAAAYWLASRSRRWWQYASWREALWISDAFGGPPPLKPAPPLKIPLSRFFRGHNLANFRTGSWEGPVEDWSLFSLVCGPHSIAEHDQTDKGSFTFYALGEQFAVDSGYGDVGSKTNDVTAAHNYLLIDGEGQPGPFGRTAARVRSHFTSAIVDAVHADLKPSFVSYPKWLEVKPETWPVRSAERCALFVKFPDRAPYVVLYDSIEKDANPHTYEWLLHTANGNKIGIGEAVQIRAKRAALNVHLSASSPVEFRQDVWRPLGEPEHPRLVAAVKAPNPRILAILVPEREGETDPLKVKMSPGAAVVAQGYTRDLILAGGNQAKAGDLESDATLAMVRLEDRRVWSWIVLDGTTLAYRGRTLWSSPKRASACFDGSSLSASSGEATRFEASVPGLKEFRNPSGVLAAQRSEETLSWKGKRPLDETLPPDTPVLREDFANPVAPFWHVIPEGEVSFTRVVDGELCCAGASRERISYSRWVDDPARPDVIQWPRTVFGDVEVAGEFTIREAAPGATLKIGRVLDRNFPWRRSYAFQSREPDQDCVEVELALDPGRGVLSKRVDGKVTDLGSFSAKLPRGKKVGYRLSIQGDKISFWLDGARKIDFKDKPGPLPSRGYVQWEVSRGLHLHMDNIRISIDP